MCNEVVLMPTGGTDYQIIIEGMIDESWSNWLGDLQITVRKGSDDKPITVLRGVLSDQVALRGLMNRIWDLNLVVLSLQQVD